MQDGLSFPHLWIEEERLKHRVVRQKKENAENSQAGSDEMKYGEQIHVVHIDLALVSGQGRELIHTFKEAIPKARRC
jgi:hypothetical protein